MNYVTSLDMFGVEAKEIPCVRGKGVPNKSTAGAVGCLYMDVNTGVIYKCTELGVWSICSPLKKRYLLIGDSYGQGARSQVGVKGWAPLFKEKMGLSDNDCIINTLGGSGFVQSVSKKKNGIIIDAGVDEEKEYRFIDLLYYTATITETNNTREIKVSEVFPVTNPETITDIIVCGGYNDKGSPGGAIAGYISAFIAKAKQLYPNAEVSIGMVGCSSDSNNAYHTQQIASNSLMGYAGVLTSCQYPYRYLNNVEYVLKLSPSYMYEEGVSDNIHPTAVGYEALANAITKAVKGGFTVGYNSYRPYLNEIEGVTIHRPEDNPTWQPDIIVKINNAITEIYMDSCTFKFEEGRSINANELIQLAKFDPSTSLITGTHHDPANGIYNRTGFVPVTGHYQCTQEHDGGKFHLFTGKAGVTDGKLCLILNALADNNYGWATNIPIQSLQIHQMRITTATNIY